jgi:type IV secretory pathway TraG/TraD family ATPase VirD4
MDLLKDLSEMCGPYDEVTYSTGSSRPSGVLSGGHASRSTNVQFHRVPILTPADIGALPEWRAILTYGGGRPVLVKMLPYFIADPEMKALVDKSIELYGPKVAVTV